MNCRFPASARRQLVAAGDAGRADGSPGAVLAHDRQRLRATGRPISRTWPSFARGPAPEAERPATAPPRRSRRRRSNWSIASPSRRGCLPPRRRPSAGPTLWDNGLLATTERLLSAGGGADPQAGEKMQVDLSHVTAAVRGGLCRIASNPIGPHPLPLQSLVADSILLGGPAAAAGAGRRRGNRQLPPTDRLERRPELLRRLRLLLDDRPQRRRSAAGADGF